jgi:hypothetical protein
MGMHIAAVTSLRFGREGRMLPAAPRQMHSKDLPFPAGRDRACWSSEGYLCHPLL